MMKISDIESAEMFERIVMELYVGQTGTNKKSYWEVINMVLDTEYGKLVKNVSLECRSLVMGMKVEDVRAIEKQAIAKIVKALNNEHITEETLNNRGN